MARARYSLQKPVSDVWFQLVSHEIMQLVTVYVRLHCLPLGWISSTYLHATPDARKCSHVFMQDETIKVGNDHHPCRAITSCGTSIPSVSLRFLE